MTEDWDNHARNRLRYAKAQSEMTFARVAGMRLAAMTNPPRATFEHIPFPGHRRVSQLPRVRPK